VGSSKEVTLKDFYISSFLIQDCLHIGATSILTTAEILFMALLELFRGAQ
jgi:indole-3-glycerol phosphate synthase